MVSCNENSLYVGTTLPTKLKTKGDIYFFYFSFFKEYVKDYRCYILVIDATVALSTQHLAAVCFACSTCDVATIVYSQEETVYLVGNLSIKTKI